jgi:hypothetical protein
VPARPVDAGHGLIQAQIELFEELANARGVTAEIVLAIARG